MRITHGFSHADRLAVAALYWEAFGGKLGLALGPQPRALTFVARAASPRHALCAWDEDGALIGLAGFRDDSGSLVGGDLADMAAIYGWPGALWRQGLLGCLAHDLEGSRFHLDGLAVTALARGRGVGTRLVHAVADEARRQGHREVRLDVVDENPRARALYERMGFQAVGRRSTGPLRLAFRFRAATTMALALA